MSTRERILTIRLLEKAEKNPLYAKSLGIESVHRWINPAKMQQKSQELSDNTKSY